MHLICVSSSDYWWLFCRIEMAHQVGIICISSSAHSLVPRMTLVWFDLTCLRPEPGCTCPNPAVSMLKLTLV